MVNKQQELLFILFVPTGHLAWAQASGEERKNITSSTQAFSRQTDQQRKENDPSGKGLNRGSGIGSSVVTLIENNQVKPAEMYTTATGRRMTKEIIMFLKKEGGK